MGLYLGSDGKLKINLNGKMYKINLYSESPIVNGIILSTSDGYMLRDINGLYITTKGDD